MKKLLVFACLAAGFCSAQTPIRNGFTVFLSAAPSSTQDCRTQYFNEAVDNNSTIWVCNESTGTWTANNSSGVSVAAGKLLTVSNSITLAGTDGVVLTTPSTSFTAARTDAANTFTGVQTFSSAPVLSTNTLTSGTATVTFPTATSITVPGTVTNNCATANACSATNISTTAKIVVGITAALNGASPAIATVTGMPAFTSSSSYVCTANVNSASASTHVLAVNYVSSSSVTFTGANGATDTVSYSCIGS